MEIALAGLAAVLLFTWYAARVNARHEEKKRAEGRDDADRVVADAWDEYGVDDDTARARAALDALLREAPVAQLASKSSLVRLAVMAIRAQHYAPLPALAARATALDMACGETAALRALALAYAGEPDERPRALEALLAAQGMMGGCSSCGAGIDGRILLDEVRLATDALATEAGEPPARRDDAGEAGAPSPQLAVRFVGAGDATE